MNACLKLVLLAVCCHAVCGVCLAAEEACAVNPQIEPITGHVMLQVSQSPLGAAAVDEHVAGKVISEQAQKERSDVPSEAAKLSKSNSNKTKQPDASIVTLNEAGYQTIADMCCNYEMEEFIRRVVDSADLKVCDEGGVQGVVAWHACDKKQSYAALSKEINEATSGKCPWTAAKSGSCKQKSTSCHGAKDPMSHRRRNCGRADNTLVLDLVMQAAATQEFTEASCGTHQLFRDVVSKSPSGVLSICKIKGDITGNQSAVKECLHECCDTDKCIGITATPQGTTLQQSFAAAEKLTGAVSYLHRQ